LVNSGLRQLSVSEINVRLYIAKGGYNLSLEIDLIIIGGGVAGLSAAIQGAKLGLETMILERKNVGGKAIDAYVIKDYPGLTQISGAKLISNMKKQALENGVRIKELEEALKIDAFNDKTRVISSKDIYFVKSIIIATGGRYKKLGVPGEEEFIGKGVFHSITSSGLSFKGKNVAVVGCGDIAVLNALTLANLDANVYLICSENKLQVIDVLRRKVLRSKIKVLLNTNVISIDGDSFVRKITLFDKEINKTIELEIDGVFVALGIEPESDIAKQIGVSIDKNGYIVVDKKQRTNIPGIFAAGNVTNGILKVAVSIGEGATAAISAYEYIKGVKVYGKN